MAFGGLFGGRRGGGKVPAGVEARARDAEMQMKNRISQIRGRLTAAQSRGMDVSAYLGRLDGIDSMVNSAEQQFNAGNYQQAKQTFLAARNNLKTLVGEMKANAGRKQ